MGSGSSWTVLKLTSIPAPTDDLHGWLPAIHIPFQIPAGLGIGLV